MSFFSSVNDRIERLGLPIPKDLHKFLAVGLVGLAIHTGVFTLLYKLNDHVWVAGIAHRLGDPAFATGVEKLNVQHSWAWLIALILATAVTWTLNRKITFKASGRKLHEEALRYAIVTIVSQSISYLVFHTLIETVKLIPPPLDVMIGAAVATVFSYAGSRFFTFAPHPGQNAEPAEPADPNAPTAPK